MADQHYIITGSSGYIGSALAESLRKDVTHNNTTLGIDLKNGVDYRSWDIWPRYAFLEKVRRPHIQEILVHLAGHSSRKACTEAPVDAWSNNVTGFEKLLRNIPDDVMIIYASSATVYDDIHPPELGCDGDDLRTENSTSPFGDIPDHYSLSKNVMDQLALRFIKDHPNRPAPIYGLRLGTVYGVSPHMRDDTLINAMMKSGVETNEIHVYNSNTLRSVLWMEDLIWFIRQLVDKRPASGVYNLATIGGRIWEYAHVVEQALLKFNHPGGVKIHTHNQDRKSGCFMSMLKSKNVVIPDLPPSVVREHADKGGLCNIGFQELYERYRNGPLG